MSSLDRPSGNGNPQAKLSRSGPVRGPRGPRALSRGTKQGDGSLPTSRDSSPGSPPTSRDSSPSRPLDLSRGTKQGDGSPPTSRDSSPSRPLDLSKSGDSHPPKATRPVSDALAQYRRKDPYRMQMYGGQSGSPERSQTAPASIPTGFSDSGQHAPSRSTQGELGKPHGEPGLRRGSLASFLRESPSPERGTPSGERTHQHLEEGGRRDGETAENLRAKKEEAQGRVDAINGEIKQAERSMRALFANPPEDKKIREILDKWNEADNSPTSEKHGKIIDAHNSLRRLGVSDFKKFNELRKEDLALERALSSAEENLRVLGGDPHSSEALFQPTQDQPGVQRGGTSELHGDSRSASIREESPGRGLESDAHQKEVQSGGEMQERTPGITLLSGDREARKDQSPHPEMSESDLDELRDVYGKLGITYEKEVPHANEAVQSGREMQERNAEILGERIRKQEKVIGEREKEINQVKEDIRLLFKENTESGTVQDILDHLDRGDTLEKIQVDDEALSKELKTQRSKEYGEANNLIALHAKEDVDFDSEKFAKLREDYKILKEELDSNKEDLRESQGILDDLSKAPSELHEGWLKSSLREESKANKVAKRDVGIRDKWACDTPDRKNNCAGYAILGAASFDMGSEETRKVVEEIKLSLVIDDKVKVTRRDQMLEFNSYEDPEENRQKGSGEQAFLRLRREGFIDPGRGLRVYSIQYGSMRFNDVIESDPGKEPVCIYLNREKNHFEALTNNDNGGGSNKNDDVLPNQFPNRQINSGYQSH